MAFSSRFSFWEQKVKDENKPGAKSVSPDNDSLCSRAQSVPALDPGRGIFRAKSPPSVAPTEPAARVRSPSPPRARPPVTVPDRFKSPEPPSKMLERFRSPELPRVPMSPEPVMNGDSKQNGTVNKSAVNGTASGNIKVMGTGTILPDVTDDQGLTRKKVVKVVRRVVRKVLPTDEEEATVLTQTATKALEPARPGPEPAKLAPTPAPASAPRGFKMSAFSFKHDTIHKEEKDDISQGLSSLMGRGRTREPRPRIRKDEALEKVERVEKIEEKKEEKDISKPMELNCNRKSFNCNRKAFSCNRKSFNCNRKSFNCNRKSFNCNRKSFNCNRKAFNCNRKSFNCNRKAFNCNRKSFNCNRKAFNCNRKSFNCNRKSFNCNRFIPPPKPSPMSPPPGFVPRPKSTPAAKSTPPTPPSTTPTPPKSSPHSPPAAYVPAPKPSPLSPPVGFVPPRPKPSPLSPPPGSVPAQKEPAANKQEEAPLSPTEEAQRRLMRIFTAPVNGPRCLSARH
ncbi:uncharacterized protein [Centroberyx affinis]|uniref:uncharacterized protein n=1 Tax=Centroberyx affinis TaxID=166261 RepID=UPI003A5C51F2